MADELGKAIDHLRKLNVRVPRTRQLPSALDVQEAEAEVGVELHPDFRRYLREASDVVFGTLEPVSIGTGHTDFVTVIRGARASGIATDLVPICEDNGDYYCMHQAGGIVYCSHNGASEERWADLATWIEEVWISGN